MELGPQNVQRIVVRGTNWVGDAVMTIPALRELRHTFPQAHITLATRAWAEGLFRDVDFIDDLLIHENTGLRSVVQQVRQWQKRNFDLAILFPNSLESGLVASLARVPIRTGYATEGRQRLLTHPLALPDWRSSRHEVFYYLNVISELKRQMNMSPHVAEPDASLFISEQRADEARAFLRYYGTRDGRWLIALCPGSINSRAKRWPTERYAALADRFVDDLHADVLLVGSSAELDVSLEVQQQMHNPPLVLTGKTDLSQLVGILAVEDLLVTNDTGPAHIASSLNRPTLVIFGPTNPLTTRPFSRAGEMIRLPPDCAPCMLRDCPIDHRCMTAITPAEVFEKAKRMLRTTATRVEAPAQYAFPAAER